MPSVLQDGRNYTAASRFPCYYTKKYQDFVAAHLDLEVRNIMRLSLSIPPSVRRPTPTSCSCCSSR